MKKVFLIRTRAEDTFGDLNWYEFAENIKEAVIKVQEIISIKEYIESAEFVCNVDENIDLEEYKRERDEIDKLAGSQLTK